jgi:hypothetical protein
VDARVRVLILVLTAASVALGIVLGVRVVDAFG